MRQLVRDQRVLIPQPISICPGIRQPIHQRGGTHVLHPADEVGYRRLRVFGPGIFHAGEPGIHLNDVRRDPEEPASERQVLGMDVVLDRDVAPAIGRLF